MVLLAAPAAAQECSAYGPVHGSGPGGTVTAQPIYSISGACPDTPCQFMFRATVFIGPVPGSQPPALPQPEPAIFLGVSLNGAPVTIGQITTPPALYQWTDIIHGPLPCGQFVTCTFSYIPFGSPNPVLLGTINWTCTACLDD